MKRIASRIDTLQISTTRVTGGIAGTLRRSDDVWVWTCPDTHRTEQAAKACVRTELKRWVA